MTASVVTTIVRSRAQGVLLTILDGQSVDVEDIKAAIGELDDWQSITRDEEAMHWNAQARMAIERLLRAFDTLTETDDWEGYEQSIEELRMTIR